MARKGVRAVYIWLPSRSFPHSPQPIKHPQSTVHSPRGTHSPQAVQEKSVWCAMLFRGGAGAQLSPHTCPQATCALIRSGPCSPLLHTWRGAGAFAHSRMGGGLALLHTTPLQTLGTLAHSTTANSRHYCAYHSWEEGPAGSTRRRSWHIISL